MFFNLWKHEIIIFVISYRHMTYDSHKCEILLLTAHEHRTLFQMSFLTLLSTHDT
jgi:hypothetical protein